MHVGASNPRRRWPAQRFGQIARQAGAHGVDVVVVGDRADAEDVEFVAKRAGAHGLALAGTLDPLLLGALMRGGGAFLGNDSGPMHLAAAAGLPVVEVSMHPRNGSPLSGHAPERYGPWGVPAVVAQPEDFLDDCGPVCKPADPIGPAHCILQVSVDQVWGALSQLVTFEEDEPAPAGVGSTGGPLLVAG